MNGEHAYTEECWEPDSGCDMGRNEKYARTSDPVSFGRRVYEADLKKRPTYHDGSPRKDWNQLGEFEQSTWEETRCVCGIEGFKSCPWHAPIYVEDHEDGTD